MSGKPNTKVTIEVTAEDIAQGKRVDPWGCMVARALKRTFPDQHVSVIGYRVEAGGFKFRLPDSVFKRVVDFDNWRPVSPFSFEFDLGAAVQVHA